MAVVLVDAVLDRGGREHQRPVARLRRRGGRPQHVIHGPRLRDGTLDGTVALPIASASRKRNGALPTLGVSRRHDRGHRPAAGRAGAARMPVGPAHRLFPRARVRLRDAAARARRAPTPPSRIARAATASSGWARASTASRAPTRPRRWRPGGRSEGRGVVVLPTGAGKTWVACLAIDDRRRSTLVVAPDAGSRAPVVRRAAHDVRRPGRRHRRRRVRRALADGVDLRLGPPAHGAPRRPVRAGRVRRVPPPAGAGLRAGGARVRWRRSAWA